MCYNGSRMIKRFKSPNYNFVFNMEDGFFARWGKNKEDDPEYSEFGNEILDIEVSTICHQLQFGNITHTGYHVFDYSNYRFNVQNIFVRLCYIHGS